MVRRLADLCSRLPGWSIGPSYICEVRNSIFGGSVGAEGRQERKEKVVRRRGGKEGILKDRIGLRLKQGTIIPAPIELGRRGCFWRLCAREG